MQIGFALLLPTEPFNYARRIELELCRLFGTREGLKQPPHITFKAPFAVDDVEPFATYLDDLAAKTQPFDVTLECFGAFAPRALFLDVQSNHELLALHLRVLDELDRQFHVQPGRFEGPHVKFHSTVAITDLTEESFVKAQDWLRQQRPRFTFPARTFGLFYRLEPDGGWIIYHESELKNPQDH